MTPEELALAVRVLTRPPRGSVKGLARQLGIDRRPLYAVMQPGNEAYHATQGERGKIVAVVEGDVELLAEVRLELEMPAPLLEDVTSPELDLAADEVGALPPRMAAVAAVIAKPSTEPVVHSATCTVCGFRPASVILDYVREEVRQHTRESRHFIQIDNLEAARRHDADVRNKTGRDPSQREPPSFVCSGGVAPGPWPDFNRKVERHRSTGPQPYIDTRSALRLMKQPTGFAGAGPIQRRPTWRADEGPRGR